MRARGVWLLLPLSWAVSCGGRYLEPGETTYAVGGSSNTQGGSATAQAGKSGSGPKAGSGGKGGAPSTGGGCACDPIACAVGYVQVKNPNDCCSHCELDASACARARQDYAEFKRQLLDKYSSVYCYASTECGIYYEANRCGSSCGIPIFAGLLKDLDANLTNYANANCPADCPPVPIPPCEPPAGPLCLEGACL
jgi:hypothetical protein